MLRLNSKDSSNNLSKLKTNRTSLNDASISSTSQSSSSSSGSTTLVNNNNNNNINNKNIVNKGESSNETVVKNQQEFENDDEEEEDDEEGEEKRVEINEEEDDDDDGDVQEQEEIEEDLAYDDDDDDDDEEYVDDEEDEEDEESFLSPMVQVKYGVEYDYDEKKFELVEGEKLFLISKANEDWWLCLRLEENLTFFVPASYVKELVVNRSNIKPPPRPPPPPPSILNKYSMVKHTSTKAQLDQQNPPEIKKRQFALNSKTTTNEEALNVNNQEQNIDLEEIYENLSNLNTKELTQDLVDGNNDNENDNYIDSMLKELEELDESLEKEERSSFVNNTITNNQPSGIQESSPKSPDYVRFVYFLINSFNEA